MLERAQLLKTLPALGKHPQSSRSGNGQIKAALA
jgi:hypothetical protein